MFTWLVVEEGHGAVLPAALGRALRDGAARAVLLDLPARRRPHPLLFAWADDGAAARRSPRWPDLLAEWSDIYGEPLYPDDAMPVLAEEASALGADALLVHAGPGLAAVTIGWYERGALASLEHVGGAAVAWPESGGLGRPMEGGVRGALAAGARKLADGADDLVLDRIEQSARATGAALIERALFRFLAADPPPFDELSGLIARAAPMRIDPA